MIRKKGKETRILAVILTLVMVFTSTPYTALAAENEKNVDVSGDFNDKENNDNGAGDVSDGTGQDTGVGDVSDGSGQDIEASDVSDGSCISAGDVSDSDREEPVSGNDVLIYRGEESATGSLCVEGESESYSYNSDRDVITVKNGANLTIKSADGYSSDNFSQTRIVVEANASVTLTLDGVYIDAVKEVYGDSPIMLSDDSTGNVSIILKGENVLIAGDYCAGIQKNGDAENIGTLTISGDGSLEATGGMNGAGIGGGSNKAGSNILIKGGTITAIGGYRAAGIGGGQNGAGSNIHIEGGKVTATSGTRGAGIGGGAFDNGSNIYISGGTVIATATSWEDSVGAGIGGGASGVGSNIYIRGGTVTATSSATAMGSCAGAGIGGGSNKAGDTITISGGTVIAASEATGGYGYSGAGIGGGENAVGSNITISGGTVTATSRSTSDDTSGEGIGNGGRNTEKGSITITGGNVKANSSGEISNAAGTKVYPAKVDLLPLSGRNALIGNPLIQTYNTETENIEYSLQDACTMDGYLYMYLPVNDQNTVTRLVFENTVYEGIVGAVAYNGNEFNTLLLQNSTDGKAEYGEVLREDIPEDGVVPDGLWMAGINADGYLYTGRAITPAFRVYDGKKMLEVKKDYTVSYKNNVNAATAEDAKKAPTIIVKSTGNYQGTATYTFTICPCSLSAEENTAEHVIQADDLYLAAPTGKNPKGIKAVPVVTDNGKKLVENKDYIINHITLNEQNGENNNTNSYVNPGRYTVEIVGKGNYTGIRQIIVALTDVAKEQLLMSKVTIAKVPDVTYDAGRCAGIWAEGMTPALTVTYGSGKNKVTLYREGDVNAAGETVSAENADYTVIWLNNKQVGTATAVLTGTGRIAEDGTVTGKYFGEKRITFKIKGAALSANMVSWLDGSKSVSLAYNGEEQRPAVRVGQQKKVKDENGKTITQTTWLSRYDDYYQIGDYKVSYLNNVNAGTATVVVTGVNGYTGTVKKTFKITPADLTATDMEAKITAAENNVTNESQAATGSNAAKKSQVATGSNDEAEDGVIKAAYARNGAKPAIVVTAKLAGENLTLTEGRDYTVSYANNKAISEGKNLAEKKLPVITIKGRGNYKGSINQTFTITGKSLADTQDPVTVTVSDVAANKNKGKFVSKPVVTDADGVKLKEKTDYTVSYSLVTEEEIVGLDTKTDIVSEPGSVIRMTITGAGNYRGEDSVLTADYRITELAFGKTAVKVVPKTFTYTKKPVTLTGDDLVVTMKVGSGKQAVVEELPLITDGDDTRDGYKIIGYQNNVNKGTAQVTLKGCGRYGGTKTVKFYIGTRPFFWWIYPTLFG